MIINSNSRALTPEHYSSPRLRIVEVKTRNILCQSRDIKDAGEDYEDVFGNDYGD